MPTAKREASGTYRVRVYSHTGPDGKQHYKSFTASTKAEAEQLAASFSGKTDRARYVNLTVSEAVDGYISAKTGVLSPSTIRGYRQIQRTHFDRIARKRIRRLTTAELQAWVSDLAKSKSAKTVNNVYGLLVASVTFYAPDVIFRVKLPQKQKKRSHAATGEQVSELFRLASQRLKKCIALAAFASMRRGEICALKYGDIEGNRIHVHADMVHAEDGEWIYKPYPKTADSDRFTPIPEKVLEILGNGDPDDYIVGWIPDTVTKRFIDLRDQLGLGEIRFHDLRKFYMSIAMAIGIPDIYAGSFGGYTHGSKIMKEIYQQKIDPIEEQYADKLCKHFSDLIS